MCKEDLQLGRGRFIRPAKKVVYGAFASGTIMPADDTRVAIIISYTQLAIAGTSHFPLHSGDDFKNVPFVAILPGTPPFVMRVEEFGQLVTSSISGNSADLSGGNLYLQGVYSQVKAEPMAR